MRASRINLPLVSMSSRITFAKSPNPTVPDADPVELFRHVGGGNAYASELYPTELRSRANGITYGIGRVAKAGRS